MPKEKRPPFLRTGAEEDMFSTLVDDRRKAFKWGALVYECGSDFMSSFKLGRIGLA